MDDTRQKLIAWMIGDLSPEESRPFEASLAADADLQRQRNQLERTLTVVRAVPSEDVSDKAFARLMAAAAHVEPESADPAEAEMFAVDETPDNVIRINFLLRTVMPRVAAVAVIVFIFGLGVWITPGSLKPTVAGVYDDHGMAMVVDGDLVESRVGEPRRLTFPTGEVLLDGASAVRVHATGPFSAPSFEVERGRVVVTASATPVSLNVGGRSVQLGKGSMLSVDYDHAYANIAEDGSIVEVQRMPIGEVAALAEKAYNVKLYAGGVPESVRNTRVSFYGSNLNAEAFIDSFVEAASRFGVTIDETRRYLSYESRSGRVEPNEEWKLDIAVLQGAASVSEEGYILPLGGKGLPNFVSYNASEAGHADLRGLGNDDLNRQVVWAAGATGATSGALGERLRDVKPSAEPLPNGSVIHTDSLVLNGDGGKRIFKLGGPDFDFPLAGGRRGRLVQLTNSGAVFEIQGEIVREFVPFGQPDNKE
ncbi:MAG: hypothetical protein KDB90_00755 [Planctomycetes bacterium]|nr:hypothetical protein [Planctomycetota bacterium]